MTQTPDPADVLGIVIVASDREWFEERRDNLVHVLVQDGARVDAVLVDAPFRLSDRSRGEGPFTYNVLYDGAILGISSKRATNVGGLAAWLAAEGVPFDRDRASLIAAYLILAKGGKKKPPEAGADQGFVWDKPPTIPPRSTCRVHGDERGFIWDH